MDLSALPIYDHHAHPLLAAEATATPAGFRRWFTESTDPAIHEQYVESTLLYRTAIRWLAARLDCDATVEAVLAARTEHDYTEWTRILFEDAGIETVLCDYGYGDASALTHDEMQATLPCPVAPILRLESLAEDLIREHEMFDQMVEAFVEKLSSARDAGYVALKSIVAYRSGLDVGPVSRDAAVTAFVDLSEKVARGEPIRLERKPLCDYLLTVAFAQAGEQRLPVQLHTGFGDSDADLRDANPLHLRWVIEEYPEVPLVLLHAGWPYYRELAHLAAIYPNVWLDISLAVPFATAGIPTMLRDVLGMTPFTKVLYATDAFTMPEIYWVATRWGRWGLEQVLSEFVREGFLSANQATRTAEAILAGNARALYNLSFS